MPEHGPAALWAPRAWLTDASGNGGWRERVLCPHRHRRLLVRGRGRRRASTRRGARGSPALCCRESSTRTATPSSALSPGWRSGASPGPTTSGPGATACTTSRCASRRASCAQSPRSSMSNCSPAATRRSANSTTCSTTATADRYDDRLELSWALADAASEAGIGLTVLPVLYERAGFARPALRDDQRRFAMGAADLWRAARAINDAGRPLAQRGPGDPLAARRGAGVDRRTAPPRRPFRRADPYPRGRADGRGRRLPDGHRRAADPMAGPAVCSIAAGIWCTPPTRRRRKSRRWPAAAPRW